MKFCKDCKHCIVDEADKVYQFAKCELFEKLASDYLVNGIHQYSYCATQRNIPSTAGNCGIDAQLFEAKDETVPA